MFLVLLKLYRVREYNAPKKAQHVSMSITVNKHFKVCPCLVPGRTLAVKNGGKAQVSQSKDVHTNKNLPVYKTSPNLQLYLVLRFDHLIKETVTALLRIGYSTIFQ